MASLSFAHVTDALTHAAEAALTRIAAVSRHVVKVLEGRRAIRSLAEMDALQLKDIGLTRSDVSAAFEQPFEQDPTRMLAELRGLPRMYR